MTQQQDIRQPGSAERLGPHQVLEVLGQFIVRGTRGYRPGEVISVETIARRVNTSKTSARDAVQALSHLRLVTISPRVGAIVEQPSEWDMLDPSVIRWRLEQPAARHVRRSLAELRAAVEPAAARLAALRIPESLCRDMYDLGEQLFQIGTRAQFDDPDRREFRDVDGRFHTMVLTCSGNEFFRTLAHPVALAMNHRIDRRWAGDRRRRASRPSRPGSGDVPEFPARPQTIALWLHRCLARAIVHGQPEAAEAFSLGILAEVDGELPHDTQLREEIDAGLGDIELDPGQRREARAAVDAACEAAGTAPRLPAATAAGRTATAAGRS